MRGIVIEGCTNASVRDNQIIDCDDAIVVRNTANLVADGNRIARTEDVLAEVQCLSEDFATITRSDLIEAVVALREAENKDEAFKDTTVGRIAIGASGGGIVQAVMAALEVLI